ncbi:hypothetical protein P8452_31876 [Trifolium repens]|nr:hypothetical protein P8452_31876 [Trifolium repens]
MEADHSQNFIFTAPACNKPPDEGVAAKTPSTQKKISFKDMVMGNKEPIATGQKVDLLKDKPATIEYQDGNPLAPMVHIEDKVFEGDDSTSLHVPEANSETYFDVSYFVFSSFSHK